MKFKIATYLFLLYSTLGFSQSRLSIITDSLRMAGNYSLELKYHLQSYKADSTDASNIYNIACCYSQLKSIDSAFYYLNKAIDFGQNDGWALEDYSLKNLHSQKEWVLIENRIESIFKLRDTTINVQLGWELSKMYYADQVPKIAEDDVLIKYGIKSHQMDSLNSIIAFTDSINMLKLEKIINQYGWPNKKLVGLEGVDRAFIVLLHAPLSFQKKYFSLIENSANIGDINKQSIAYLTDKILTKEGKKQIYGTQLKYNSETLTYELKPIEDEVNVNSRRSKLGMSSIEDYAKRWGIDYKK